MSKSLFVGVSLLLVVATALFAVLDENSSTRADDGEMNLPDGYVSDMIYSPPLAGLSRITRSENGEVFVRHLNPSGGVRVSQLDVDQDQMTMVLDLPPWTQASIIVGGPGDTFFIQVENKILQVQADGTYSVWGPGGAATAWYYTPAGRMLGIADAETAVVEMFPDGTLTYLVTGLSLAYDVVADESGAVFIADFMAESLIRLDTDGSTSFVASIAPDNTDLTLDGDGDLYLNNAAAGFARVDKVTGALTPMTLTSPPCPVVQSPADVLFDDSGRAVFASWVDSRLTWVDFDEATGGELQHQPWANSHAVDIGPDDALYVGVDGCGSAIPSKIVRFTIDGSSEVYLDGLNGRITNMTFDSSGGLYFVLGTETSVGLYYLAPGDVTPSQIPTPAGYDFGALAADPLSGNLFVNVPPPSPTAANATILEFTLAGLQDSHIVDVPKPVMDMSLDFAPDGTLYAFASEVERFMTGPEVDRWILRLNPGAGTHHIVAQVNRIGCCPMGSFSVDSAGTIWWILNPDFLLYSVSPPGSEDLFADNLPVDSGSAGRTTQGDIFLNTPEGIFRIWEATLAERVKLIIADLEELVDFGALSEGRGNALGSKLGGAVISLDDGQSKAAVNQLEAFLHSVNAYVKAGLLSEERADELLLAVGDVIDRI